MNWTFLHHFLDQLDSVLNANSFWLPLSIPQGKFDLNQVLVQHLRTGSFHFELVKQDLQRGWNNYSETIYPKDQETGVLLQRPGNTWNGNEELELQLLSQEELALHLRRLLVSQENTSSKSQRALSQAEAQSLIAQLFQMLDAQAPAWHAYFIPPNFLHTVDDYVSSGYIQLGYFEKAGRDLAIAFLLKEELFLLLTNGYG